MNISKKIYLPLAALTFLCLSLQAQSINEKQAIMKVLHQQQADWNKGDLEGYMQGYVKSDSLLFLGKRGPTYGWQQTLDNYRKGYPDKSAMGQLTFDIQKVELLSDSAAFVMGGWHLQREKDEPQGFFTLILKKIGGSWKVVSDHSSSSGT